jgi:hypothetical protein
MTEEEESSVTKTVVYPADEFGCGSFRLIWPVQALHEAGRGSGVELVRTQDRQVRMAVKDDHISEVWVDADVVVFQRTTHRYLAEAVPILRSKGVAVVIDVDDDLSTIHPRNPAYPLYHPANAEKPDRYGRRNLHSWRNLADACREATLVTVSTPALLDVYARHGRGVVLPNCLPEHYYGITRTDSDEIGWPAQLATHPNDPEAVGGAVARLAAEGASFRILGDGTGSGPAFGLLRDAPCRLGIGLEDWPGAVAELGIGIAPLADTRFNRCKSWLKPLEMSAVGVPWVGSPRAEYAKLHRMGAGILADNSRRWYQALDRLRRDPSLRAELSEAGRAVAEKMRLRDHAERWLDAWDRAAVLQRGQQVRV